MGASEASGAFVVQGGFGTGDDAVLALCCGSASRSIAATTDSDIVALLLKAVDNDDDAEDDVPVISMASLPKLVPVFKGRGESGIA